MLEHLQIRGLATIDSVDIEFKGGFAALSGETGAGKSILLDALGLALGKRADSLLVREGADRAEVSATFSVDPASSAAAWMRDAAVVDPEQADLCILRRVIQPGGRSRAFVNGSAVTVSQLLELGDHLVDILGQNENQSLRLNTVQREVLDAYAGHQDLMAKVRQSAQAWKAIEHEIQVLREASARDPAQIDWLRHQVAELKALNLADGEIDRIDEEHRRLANGGRLIEEGSQTQDILYGADGAVHDQLASCANRLEALAQIDPTFAEAESLVRSAQAQVREAASELRRRVDRLDLDPGRLQELEARLSEIHEQSRKHRVRPEELPARQAALETELEQSEASGGQLESLLKRQDQQLAEFKAAAEALSASRSKAASAFCEAVCAHLVDLGMPNARLGVRLESTRREAPASHGVDEISFEFSANPGQAPRSLAKVASGGELSRISLAIQVVAQAAGGAPTLIFDEVDAGIGGAVAEAVGRLLRQLGQSRQVLSVTHLGQVAASAGHQYMVSKRVDQDATYTSVTPLDPGARVKEVARMIGGSKISKATEALARELLETVQKS